MSQSWLLDVGIDDARNSLSEVIAKMRQCEQWSAELESVCRNIPVAVRARRALSAAIGLVRDRRNSHASPG